MITNANPYIPRIDFIVHQLRLYLRYLSHLPSKEKVDRVIYKTVKQRLKQLKADRRRTRKKCKAVLCKLKYRTLSEWHEARERIKDAKILTCGNRVYDWSTPLECESDITKHIP